MTEPAGFRSARGLELRRLLRRSLPIVVVAGITGILAFQIARPGPNPEFRQNGVLLRYWAAGVLDSAARDAGISFTTRPSIRPLEPRRLGSLRLTEDYHVFIHRCSSCHDPPDPSMHTPDEWPWVVRRMARWMDKAGVMPMPPAESLAIMPFLDQASRARR